MFTGAGTYMVFGNVQDSDSIEGVCFSNIDADHFTVFAETAKIVKWIAIGY